MVWHPFKWEVVMKDLSINSLKTEKGWGHVVAIEECLHFFYIVLNCARVLNGQIGISLTSSSSGMSCDVSFGSTSSSSGSAPDVNLMLGFSSFAANLTSGLCVDSKATDGFSFGSSAEDSEIRKRQSVLRKQLINNNAYWTEEEKWAGGKRSSGKVGRRWEGQRRRVGGRSEGGRW